MANNNPEIILPSNVEAERAILGAILLANDEAQTVRQKLQPEDFYFFHHKKLFQAMLAMHDTRQAIDLVTLTEFLTRTKQLENAGGVAYVSQLMDGTPHVTNVAFYADIVKEKSRLRQIIRNSEEIQKKALEGAYTSDDLNQQIDAFARTQAIAPANGNGHIGHNLMDFLQIDFPQPEHLVEGLIPKGEKIMIIAMPHRMKSWFTTSMALAATRAGTILGKLVVPKPVRTMLVQVEDSPGEVQKRLRALLGTSQFMDIDPDNLRIVDRTEFQEFNAFWCERLVRQAIEWRADLIIFDVLRLLFITHGDINSSTDCGLFLQIIDKIRTETGAAVCLVHHENRKGAELMLASAGSWALPSWATSQIHFKKKTEEKGVTSVEIEVDNKASTGMDPMRMVLNFQTSMPVVLENLEEGTGFTEAMADLGSHWTLKDLMEVLQTTRSSANRRLRKWIEDGKVEKVSGGKKGRGGQAVYQEISKL